MDHVGAASGVPAPMIVTESNIADKGVNVVLLRGKPRPWWEGLDGRLRRGDPVQIPQAAVRAFGREHWDGRQDVTVIAPVLQIATTVNGTR